MTVNQIIKEQINEKIEHLPAERLADVLEFLLKIEEEEQHVLKILSFAGTWKELAQDVLSDLTVDLHQNRLLSDRKMDLE